MDYPKILMNVNESHKRCRKWLEAEKQDIPHDDPAHYDFLIEDDELGAFPIENRGYISIANYKLWLSQTDSLCLRDNTQILKSITSVPER